MICNYCGKSNENGFRQCAYCGAEMPSMSACGGFADILKFNSNEKANVSHAPAETQVFNDKNKAEASLNLTMQKIINKSDSIIKSTKRNSVLGIIAIGISILIVVVSIITCIITTNTIKDQKIELMTQVTETKKEFEEYKNKIDIYVSEIRRDTNGSKNEITNSEETDKSGNDVSNNFDEKHDEVDKPSFPR